MKDLIKECAEEIAHEWDLDNGATEPQASLIEAILCKHLQTPNTKLPPLGEGPRRKMLIEVEVTEDFEKRLDNQWMVEREIQADRWAWKWGHFYERDEATCVCQSSYNFSDAPLPECPVHGKKEGV